MVFHRLHIVINATLLFILIWVPFSNALIENYVIGFVVEFIIFDVGLLPSFNHCFYFHYPNFDP